MDAYKDKHVGASVIYIDPMSQAHEALVTACWGEMEEDSMPSLNLVYVSSEPSETDQYGRQIKRVTSIPHKSRQAAPANFWVTQLEFDPK